jgi:hypothetical protein
MGLEMITSGVAGLKTRAWVQNKIFTPRTLISL